MSGESVIPLREKADEHVQEERVVFPGEKDEFSLIEKRDRCV